MYGERHVHRLVERERPAPRAARVELRPRDGGVAGLVLGPVALPLAERRALRNGELVLHFQPTLDVGSGELAGAEALVRWEHPTRGLLPPPAFLPLVEQTGIMRPLTLRVLGRNERARALYSALGFVVEGILREEFLLDGQYVDDVLMALPLT